MKNIWLPVLGVLAFAVTLAAIVGTRLATTGALAVALGVSVGIVAGVLSGLLIVFRLGRLAHPGSPEEQQATIVMTPEQADTLIRLLASRRQASPESFPMVAAERHITAVGGANLDEMDE
jgi:hypothetical protein